MTSLTSEAFYLLKNYEHMHTTQGEVDPRDDSSVVISLKLIVVQQQRQIEMLARILSKAAPQEYINEMQKEFAVIEGFPDIADDIATALLEVHRHKQ